MDVIGGAQNHVDSLIKKLKEDCHEVIIITGSYKEELWTFKEQQIPVIQIPSLQREINLLKDLNAYFQLRKILKSINPDLVAIHSTKAGVIGRLAAYSLNINTIFTAHGWSFTEGVSPIKKVIYKRVEKCLGLISNKIIAVSDNDRELALSNKIVRPEKILTIHNGIIENPMEISNSHRKTLKPTVVMVARFEYPKRQDLLIEALKDCQDLNWHLVFVGEGKNQGKVKKLVQSYGMQQRVAFYKSTTNIEKQLNNSHVFILLSNYEGLPLSIIEAMRAGLPVIASDVGGVKELVHHNKTGYLVTTDNLPMLTEALRYLLTKQDIAIKMGYYGKQLFLRNFTFKTMYNETMALYKRTVESKGNEKLQNKLHI